MDLEQIEKLLAMLSEHDVGEFTYKSDDFSLKLRMGPTHVVAAAPTLAPMMAVAPAVAPPPGTAEAAPSADDGLAVLESPMVGTFYRAPGPDTAVFVSVGDRVVAGQTLCIIEAMKLMNEIEADSAGEIVEISVENAQPVQFGQTLFKIRPV
jgi:acetyl-CoA carboxylase biotin carboxyl carrier protein